MTMMDRVWSRRNVSNDNGLGAPSESTAMSPAGRGRTGVASLWLRANGEVASAEPEALTALNALGLEVTPAGLLRWQLTAQALDLQPVLTQLRFCSGRVRTFVLREPGVGAVVCQFRWADTAEHRGVFMQVPASNCADGLGQCLVADFGLTPTELSVAISLGDGMSLADLAVRRGTSISTVRTQAASIFGKLGINRQGELVWVLSQLTKLLEYPDPNL